MAHGSASLTVGEVGDGAAVTSGSGVRVATGLSQPAGGDDEALAGSSRGRAKGGDDAGGGGQECAFLEGHGGASADVGGRPDRLAGTRARRRRCYTYTCGCGSRRAVDGGSGRAAITASARPRDGGIGNRR